MARVVKPGGLVAVRDADYAGFVWFPLLPELDEWLSLYRTAARVHRCARENAWAVSGRGRPDTVLMETIGGYAKAGADGVMTVSAADGTTVAVKVLGGSIPAARVAALGLLVSVGAVAPEVGANALERMDTVVTGGGVEVGRLRPVV